MDELIKESHYQEGETLSLVGEIVLMIWTPNEKTSYKLLLKEKKQKSEKKKQRKSERREKPFVNINRFRSSLDELMEQYPDDEQLKKDCANLKEEAKEPKEEESSWWRDKISDLETERDAFARMAKTRAKKSKSVKKSSLRYEKTHSAPSQKSMRLQRYQDDSIFQNALKGLKEKAQTEPYEPSEWQATLRYVEQDLDTHVEEAQERVIAQKKRKEEEEKNQIDLDKAQTMVYNLRSQLLELQTTSYDSIYAGNRRFTGTGRAKSR